MDKNILDKILPHVLKPARYINHEINAIHKAWDKTDIKVALVYSEIYEIAMSGLSAQILYTLINNLADTLAERVFAPWVDMEAKLREYKLPLCSLESGKPLSDFSVIFFSLSHELMYTNTLNVLDLGNIPIRSDQRTDDHPLVFAGGPAAFNPEPMADFIDCFFIGDGEEGIPEIIATLKRTKNSSRQDKLKELAQIKGAYVPALGRPKRIEKRILNNLDSIPYPLSPIIPYIETIHDRAAIEIMRGCPRTCRFCQASFTGYPARERSKESVIQCAEELIKNTGSEDLSLVSLSSSDYSQIEAVTKELAQKLKKKKVNISLPSLRLDTFSVSLAEAVGEVRKSGVTLAPEAGTERLRKVINKQLSDQEINEGMENAVNGGCKLIKLYFMIGLPTETDEDIQAIVDMIMRMVKHHIRVNVSINTFVPKPHTPFQWEAFLSVEEIARRQKFILSRVKHRLLKINWTDPELSTLEAILTRGDRSTGRVIEAAWKAGAKFDAWHEHFKWNIWQKAFEENGIKTSGILRIDYAAELPWDFIDCGIGKDRLIEENKKALT